jgi:hypothetical protein
MKKITFTLLLGFFVAFSFAQTVTIELLTDAYASETHWTLKDRDGNTIQSNAALSNETLVTTNISVDTSNCFTFTITDSYGDGIAGYNGSPAGSLTVKYNGTVVGGFTAANASFGDSFSVYGIGGGCTEVGGELTSINTTAYQSINSTDSVSGTFTNVGEVLVTSFDVSYNLNGDTESAIYSLTGLNIDLGEDYDFIHDVPYNFNVAGTQILNVSISNVNGGGDTDLTDNTLSENILVYTNSVQRKILLENFTTAQCVNCPPVHTMLENYVNSQPNAILLAQHAGYYTDAMTIPENTELLAMYNAGGATYAPALAIDRHRFETGLTGGASDPGPVFFPSSSSATYARMDAKLTEPSFVSVNVYGELDGTSLELDVVGNFVEDISNDDLRLVVYLMEDGLVYSQSGGSSNYVHNNAMRDALSATWGDPIGVSGNAGDNYSKHYSYTLDGSWNAANMQVVAFVTNYGSINQRDVLNAEEKELSQLTVLSTQNELISGINIYPNTASNYVKIDNAEGFDLKIFNLLGKQVLLKNNISSSETINLRSLSNGTYFVNLTSNNNRVTKKLIIIN